MKGALAAQHRAWRGAAAWSARLLGHGGWRLTGLSHRLGRADQEAALAGISIGRPAQMGQRFVSVPIVLADLVNAAGFLSSRHVASQLTRDAHHLFDLLN